MPLIRPEVMKDHRARWYYYHRGEREKQPYPKGLRGVVAWDVVCSCGWESNTGGGTRGHVKDALEHHRWSVQCDLGRERETTVPEENPCLEIPVMGEMPPAQKEESREAFTQLVNSARGAAFLDAHIPGWDDPQRLGLDANEDTE